MIKLIMTFFVFHMAIMTNNTNALHKEITVLEERFEASKLTLCNEDLDNVETIKHHLTLMVEIDQEARMLVIADIENEKLQQLIKDIDLFNTEHLKSILAIHGWINISKFGKESDHQAWLLVQHADHDRVFQEKSLFTVEKLLQIGETNKTNYAYLYDRVAINSGKKQRYGTQVNIENDSRELLPYEGTLEKVNERRHEVGLEPVEHYLEKIKSVYRVH